MKIMPYTLSQILVALATVLLVYGCTEDVMNNTSPQPSDFESPPSTDELSNSNEDAMMPYDGGIEDSAMPDSDVIRVKEAHESELMAIDGVVGVGIQRNELGDDVIVVYTLDESVSHDVPTQLEGVSVVTKVTGPIDAL